MSGQPVRHQTRDDLGKKDDKDDDRCGKPQHDEGAGASGDTGATRTRDLDDAKDKQQQRRAEEPAPVFGDHGPDG